MELTEVAKEHLHATTQQLKGSERRLFMARTVRLLGVQGQRLAERELGWNRGTIRKGMHELRTGITCVDAFSARGRKRSEQHLPRLLSDIRALVDGQCQTDPTFQTQRLFTRLTAAAVRRQLITQKGHRDAELPSVETIRCKMHDLGYHLRKVQKCKPKKRFRRPTRSSRGCTNGTMKRTKQKMSCACRWTRNQPSKSGFFRVEARVGCR